MTARARLLLVDDDKAFRHSTAALLRQDGYDVDLAPDASGAVAKLAADRYDLLLLDIRMPGLDGLRALEVLRARGLDIPVLMISGYGTIDSAVECLQLGADHFLTKPVDPAALANEVAELLERRPSKARIRRGAFMGMIGATRGMRAVFDAIQQVAPTNATVLVAGETGTGKELVACAVHKLSRRAHGRFMAVNCSALAESLLESELFGHKRGAFTGAVANKKGLFAAANGGTLFLDEIGDVGGRLQTSLLRVLEQREVLPVGSTIAEPIDVRVVAATNQDLEAAVAGGRFREDLFYRLNVFRIDIPALRDRRPDIPLLVDAALDRAREAVPSAATAVSSPALRLLRAHDWRGNVRELFGVIQSAVIRANGARVEVQHLPARVRARTMRPAGLPERGSRCRGGDREGERAAVVAALDQSGGCRTRAAEILGMSRTTLWRRMRDFGLADT